MSYAFCAGSVINISISLSLIMVPGWWSVYQAGFLHRDISIGNILIAKPPFHSKKEFCFAPEEYLLSNVEAHYPPGGDSVVAKRNELVTRIREDAEQIKTLLPQIGIPQHSAKAFVMDFDLSAAWKGYFDANHSSGSISVSLFCWT